MNKLCKLVFKNATLKPSKGFQAIRDENIRN